ncbi:NrtA/SsuA/CpmA family ABC transporter substrate-binding protein [Kitasatospora sp. NBC_01287]|uniref:NrtA/SsuA/CpmA family ABC transporter substrate-binding protein n=1 Tax=Kitasatospora sp. NBC_01287 TaxID=2903573 RepID=UPI00225417A0|nr:NrtA/SsuA/CpmA family ABC transporter substrate-binding protein [Kitasatospora sp. NBC_01287]MCX4745345.1 NrtA/SsuA/CpmA family ABC transporter substrate-binding protein [Kitasatospora sp. NBC_01287]
MNLSRPLLAAAAALLTLSLAACGSSKATAPGGATAEVTVRIPDPGNSGVLALGKKDGSLDRALAAVHAKVAWTGSAGPFAPAAQELNAGQLDFALGSITSAVTALATKPSFKLFAATDPDPVGEGILVKDGSPITSIQDLVGKKVAVNQGGTGEYLLLQALAKNGIAADQVQRVYLRPDQSAPVFSSGQVDAWATWSSYAVAALADSGAHFLATGPALGSDNYSVWAVRTVFADQHPDITKALYQYLHDGDVRAKADPAAFLNVFTDAGPLAVNGRSKQISVDFGRQNGVLSPIDDTVAARFDKVAAFYAAQKITKSQVDVRPDLLDITKLPGGSR